MTSIVATPVTPTIKIFSEPPSSSFTGMVPAYFQRIGKMNESLVACFKLLNSINLKLEKESIGDLIEAGQLSCINYNQGEIKSIFINSNWVDSFLKNGVNRILLNTGGEHYSVLDKDIAIQKLNTESYNQMSGICLPLIKV